MVVMGVVEGAGTTYLVSWMQRRTDPSMQGRMMPVAILGSVGLQPLALARAGALASRHLGLLFRGSAAAIELTAIAALSRSVRRPRPTTTALIDLVFDIQQGVFATIRREPLEGDRLDVA